MFGAFWIALSIVTFVVNFFVAGYLITHCLLFAICVGIILMLILRHHMKCEKSARATRAANRVNEEAHIQAFVEVDQRRVDHRAALLTELRAELDRRRHPLDRPQDL